MFETKEIYSQLKKNRRDDEAEHRPKSPEELAAELALITRSQAGDREAFGELVQAYEKKVFWIAFNLLNHVEDARDVAQDAFLRVFKAIDRFDPRYSFYTWLYRIVVNLAIDKLRKRSKRSGVSLEDFATEPEAEGGVDDRIRSSELGRKIIEVLDSMPQKYRTVILLRDVEQLGCEAIAEIIGCTNATTRWRLHKAREMFREKWARVEA